MAFFEKTVSSKTIYKGKIITLEQDEAELSNGSRHIREVVRHSGGVAILAVDGDENILFVRQFRYPYAQNLLEIPAGKLEKGEAPRDCGTRELLEETGYEAKEFSFMVELYPTPAYLDERIQIFLAKELEYKGQRLDSDEFLSIERYPLKKAVEMCQNGEIKDAKTLIAILMYNSKTSE